MTGEVRQPFAGACALLAEVAILSILSLVVFFSRSISFWQSLVFFGFLCLFLLDALRPSRRAVAAAWVVLLLVGSVAFTARFAVSFPLTARVDLLRDTFVRSLLDPLPLIWAAALVSGAVWILYRGYAAALSERRPVLEVAFIVFACLVVYQVSLAWRWSASTGDTTVSLPYASAALLLGVASRCAGSVRDWPPAFGGVRLLGAQLVALSLLVAHLVALALLPGAPADQDGGNALRLAASCVGLLLFAGLVHAQVAAPPTRRRFKIVLWVLLALAVASVWSRVSLLPDIPPAGVYVASSGARGAG